MNDSKPWVTIDGDCITIRNFETYNPSWGGAREKGISNKADSNDQFLFKKEASRKHLEAIPNGIGIDSSSSLNSSELEDLQMLAGVAESEPISSSERYRTQSWLAQLWDALPRFARTCRGQIGSELIFAIRRGEDPAFIIDRLRTYYNSPVGMGSHPNKAHSFLKNEMYHDADESWHKIRGDQPEGGGKTFKDLLAEAEAQKENHG